MTQGAPPSRRVALAAASNLAGQTIVVASLVVIAPIVLDRVGAASFGLWVLVGSIGSFGFLLDLGVSAAVVKYVAYHAARGETDDIVRVLAAATLIYAIMAGAVAVGGLLVWLLLPLVLSGRGDLTAVAPPLAALIGVDVAVSLLGIAPMALLRGMQRFPALNCVNAFWAVVGALLTALVLAIGGGIVSVAGVGAVNSLFTTVSYFTVARRANNHFLASPRRDPAMVRRLIRFSRSVSVVQLSGVLQGRLDALVIGIALPVRLLAPYSFAQRLASGTETITDQFSKLLLPYASEFSSSDPVRLKRVFLTATRISVALSVAAAIPLALLGGPILRLWADPTFGSYGDVVALLVAAAVIDLASHPCAAVLQSIERHGPIARMALAGGLGNVILSIALVGPLGVRGVAVATLIATVAEIALLVIPYAASVLGVTRMEFVREVVVPDLVPSGILAGLILVGDVVLPVTSLWRLVTVVGVGLLAYVTSYAIVGAPADERSIYSNFVRAVLGWAMRT